MIKQNNKDGNSILITWQARIYDYIDFSLRFAKQPAVAFAHIHTSRVVIYDTIVNHFLTNHHISRRTF
jgi:hypothetical protein